MLCLRILEEHPSLEGLCSMTFTEQEMSAYVTRKAEVREAAQRKRKRMPKPDPASVGKAWRKPQLW